MSTNRLIIGAIALGLSAGTAFAQPDKYVVIEEKTGTWCGFCPSGTVSLYNLEKNEPKFIGIAIHNGDPMTNSYYDTQSNSLPAFGGYPYSAADRAVGAHAGNSQSSFNARKSIIPVASISVVGVIDAGKMIITVTAKFAEDVTGDWRLAAVITEDKVTGSGSGYNQANYFSGGGYGPLEGAGKNWVTEPNPVSASKMEYDHVARAIADNQYKGAAGSLPASITAGTTYTHTYSVAVSDGWDPSYLSVIGMLVEPSGKINNAGKSKAQGVASIETIQENVFKLSAYPNPASDFVNLKLELKEAASVTIEVVNMLGAVVSTIDTQNLSAGTVYNVVGVESLTNGVYFIKTTVNSKVEMTKIVVKR